MRCLRCGACCRKTEMLLSITDIQRLERKGYSTEFFVRYDKADYAALRNRQEHCVFYDVENRRCRVYADRPLGCRAYPVILDEEKGIVVDNLCHARSLVTEQEKARKGKRVLKLLRNIDAEAEKRRYAYSSSAVSDQLR